MAAISWTLLASLFLHVKLFWVYAQLLLKPKSKSQSFCEYFTEAVEVLEKKGSVRNHLYQQSRFFCIHFICYFLFSFLLSTQLFTLTASSPIVPHSQLVSLHDFLLTAHSIHWSMVYLWVWKCVYMYAVFVGFTFHLHVMCRPPSLYVVMT